MKSILRKFHMLGVIVAMAVALGLFMQFTYFNKILIQDTQRITALSRDIVGKEINSHLMMQAQTISDTADYISLQQWQEKELLIYMKRLMAHNPSFSSIYFGSSDNMMINGSGWVPPPTFDLRIRPWYVKAVEEKKLIFTEAFINASKDQLIVTIAKPIYNSSNQLLGVIAGDISIKNILSVVEDKKIGEKGYSFLIDGKGNILAHPHYEYDLYTKFKNIDELSSDINGSMLENKTDIIKTSMDHTDGYLAYQPIENTDWKIGSFIPSDESIQIHFNFLIIFMITLISSLTIFAMGVLLQKKYFIIPILTLDEDVQRINIEENISYRVPVEEKDPFVILRRSINAALDKTQHFFNQLEENEEALRASNEGLSGSLQQLAISENNFRMLFEGSSDPILILKEYRFIDCNPAALASLGYDSKESILGKTTWELSPKTQLDGRPSEEKALEIIKNTLENGKSKFEWWHQKSDGTLLTVEVMCTTIMINNEKVFHVLWRDISDRKKMEQQLEYLSYHDPLTSLYNRRFFEEELARLDVEGSLPLTIVMADVNGLKLINDSFGHGTGDELLKKVAQVIKKGCRANDIIARLGGDEFVMVLPKTDSHETHQLIKRIHGLTLKEKVESMEISISFGWETKHHQDQRIQEIFKKAEDQMYKKKLFEGPSMRGKTISTIIKTLHEKNKREETHSHRVSQLCERMGRVLDLSEGEIKELKTVGLLHDIGKIAIEEKILNKPNTLTDHEWEEIKRHPEIGYRILKTVNDMNEMAEYVLAHHERWDGLGYPKGLKDKEIPLQAKIITITDAYDAMTSERAYRNPLPKELAIEELKKNAGTQFDPEITRIFVDMLLE